MRALLLTLLASCGSDFSQYADDAPQATDPCRQEVCYNLTCETVKCPYAETSSYEDDYGKVFMCEWACADYEGTPNAFVALTFATYNGSCWDLESEYVSDGFCD
jgi:hypothetical protein